MIWIKLFTYLRLGVIKEVQNKMGMFVVIFCYGGEGFSVR